MHARKDPEASERCISCLREPQLAVALRATFHPLVRTPTSSTTILDLTPTLLPTPPILSIHPSIRSRHQHLRVHDLYYVRLRVLRVAADLRVHRAVPTPELQADGRGQPVQLQQWLDPRRVPHRAVHPHVHRQQHLHPSRHPLGPHGPHVLGQVLPGSLGEDRDGGLQQHGGPAEPGGAGQQQVRHVLERRARGEAIAWGGVRAGAVSDHQPRTLNPES
mmetsp:Transcript_38671/g.121125  ORF Transcript_38671/g.121125 Transcript_38671/m.121125 type:complete len:219 (+) Transcript_38671:292-948(+)